MPEAPRLTSLDDHGVVTVTFNRPEVNNAYNGDMIQAILEATDRLADMQGARAVLLKGT